MAIRVYELSKELNIPNKELLDLLQKEGFNVKSPIATVPQETVTIIKNKLSKSSKKEDISGKANTSNTKKETDKVNKQGKANTNKKLDNTKFQSKNKKRAKKNKIINQKNMAETEKVDNKIIIAPMSVAEFAKKANKPPTEIIVTLLKKGIVANQNNVISEKQVFDLSQLYNLQIIESKEEKANEFNKYKQDISINDNIYQERPPIVVVIGHVDHGKTTLLDFIRKTHVTAKEKGGITQHLGAYKVSTEQGDMVFLDTPGHEAFSLMRTRGIKVADIAILIISAEDGVMPQTVESLKRAQEIGLPMVVAINKIDRATPAQIENVKKGLSQYNILPEEWGGETVFAAISAKNGTGVNDLLEVISLQSQLMELKANTSIPAKGYVLESKIERGLGPVATVIILHGILHIKDYFISGNTSGKVNSMINSSGKRVNSALPGIPVQVSGFSDLPKAGDAFNVVSKKESRKGSTPDKISNTYNISLPSEQDNIVNIIIKADNASSKEAIVNSIKNKPENFKVLFNIVYAGIGDISESDINLAMDTDSVIYGFTVKVQSNAQIIAKRKDIDIRIFDIIYKLLEDLEVLAEARRKIKFIKKKIGSAQVIKVFNMKKIGVIAGALVKQGEITKDSVLEVVRDNKKIAETTIKTLQIERKNVKVVQSGFECAFLANNFDDWKVDDIVNAYIEIPEEQD